ncbi:MAG: SRPBCC family protein [Bacteriovoracales bacterium]|nr:SRPBCC family protein [Bacteriovoracales bacterium]
MSNIKKTETYSVPVEKFYKVVTNYESYPDFMDGVSGVRVIQQNDNEALVEYSLNIVKEFTYRLKHLENAPHKLSWTLDSGDLLKKNDGSWEFEDLGDGRTRVTYSINIEFKLMVPKMVINKIVKNNVPKLFENLYERAKDL